ncbi:MAG TPA: hypothetical protein VGD22_15650 [Sphingobacteriaceae bacterium]
MVKTFNPSTNILATEVDYTQYIITSNVQSTFDLITANYYQGIRAFNLVGAYGTGKSTFLSAFEEHVNHEKLFAEFQTWKGVENFETIKLVGEYQSFLESFSEKLNTKSNRPVELLKALDEKVAACKKQGKGVLIFVDEFGKYLEYAAKNQAEKELYFFQQLAEYASNEEKDIIILTTLHQDFSAYAVSLDKSQRNEWTKVKGRFKEITFNEPVEQLLYLASKRLQGVLSDEKQVPFENSFKAIEKAKVFPLKDYFTKEMAEKLYPLDILSAATLALALQSYGQNERSLFTFLSSHNYLGLQDFNEKKGNFYSLVHVHDFLNHNFNSFLKSKANLDFSKWGAINITLERVEGEFEYEKHKLYYAIVKTIGLLHIFSHAGAKLDDDFLIGYIENTTKEQGVADALKQLTKRKIVRYNQYSQRYVLFEGTDIDIDVAIDEAASYLDTSTDLSSYLTKYFSLSTVSAKRIYFERGTPRIFQYKITESPFLQSSPVGEIDGFINLIFNNRIKASDVQRASELTEEAVLFGLFENAAEVRQLAEEIQKAEIAKEKHPDDKIVQRELNQIIDLQKSLLSHYVVGSFYNSNIVKWYFRGQEVQVRNNRDFNSALSNIARVVYDKSPIFKSELANKSKLSPAAATARRALIELLITKHQQENLGFNETEFPPQKSIYLSLLKETGIHAKLKDAWVLQQPEGEIDRCEFATLFEACNQFVDSSKGARRSVVELYDLLGQRPYKLKKGFLDFWIPIYLFIKNSDYALYGKNGFHPTVDADVLELIVKNPKDYSIKAFDVGGIKIQLFNQYRSLLNLGDRDTTSNEAFIQTVTPFFKFYKELPDYTKVTKRLSAKVLKVRSVLTEATDPEKLFFEDFPSSLGFDIVQLNNDPNLLNEYSETLQDAIRELRSAYNNLQDRFETIILSIWNKAYSFLEYKDQLRARYSNSLKQQLLLPYQKTFYQRLCSPLEDRNAWLSSISQAVVGKTLDKFNDQDELKLHEAFLNWIHELDNLNDIALQKIDLNVEEVFKLEITSAEQGLKNKIIRLPKQKEPNVQKYVDSLNHALKDANRFTKIAILAKLLKKELDDEGK